MYLHFQINKRRKEKKAQRSSSNRNLEQTLYMYKLGHQTKYICMYVQLRREYINLVVAFVVFS